MTRRYKSNRKESVPHKVKSHRRNNSKVKSYSRGHGKKSSKLIRTNRIVTSRRRIEWRASDTRAQRRRNILKTIPKRYSGKNRLRKAAEKLQRIALDSKEDKKTKMLANSDYDYFTERIQKFQNPVFTSVEKKESIKVMNDNWVSRMRGVREVKSFEEAHQIAEGILRVQGGYNMDLVDVKTYINNHFSMEPKYHKTTH